MFIMYIYVIALGIDLSMPRLTIDRIPRGKQIIAAFEMSYRTELVLIFQKIIVP